MIKNVRTLSCIPSLPIPSFIKFRSALLTQSFITWSEVIHHRHGIENCLDDLIGSLPLGLLALGARVILTMFWVWFCMETNQFFMATASLAHASPPLGWLTVYGLATCMFIADVPRFWNTGNSGSAQRDTRSLAEVYTTCPAGSWHITLPANSCHPPPSPWHSLVVSYNVCDGQRNGDDPQNLLVNGDVPYGA